MAQDKIINVETGDVLYIKHPFVQGNVDINTLNVKKNPGKGEFSSIGAALASITTNSASEPFLITVGSGIYIEDTLTMKPYVGIVGAGELLTIIQVDSTSKNVVHAIENSYLGNVFLKGATDSGKCAVLYDSATATDTDYFLIENVHFGDNDVLIKAFSSGNTVSVLSTNLKLGGIGKFNRGFWATNSGSGSARIQLRSVTTAGGLATPYPSEMCFVSGDDCEIIVNSAQLRTGGLTTTTCFRSNNGGRFRITAANVKGWGKGVWLENDGIGSSITISAINFENCTQDLLVEDPNASGVIDGIVKISNSFIEPTSSVFVEGNDRRMITVAKLGGEYTSIADAVDSITDSSITNQYEVFVGPGIYTEREIAPNPYISIVGSSILTTIVQPDSDSHHVFNLNHHNEISFLTIKNAGSGYSAIFYEDKGDYSQCHKINFIDNDTGITISSTTQDTFFYGEYVEFNGEMSYAVKMFSENDFETFSNLENFYIFPSTDCTGVFLSGTKTECSILTAGIYGNANIGLDTINAGDGIYLKNGATCDILSTHIHYWTNGIHTANVGSGVTLDVFGAHEENNVKDVFLEHPNTSGTLNGTFTKEKVSINDLAPISIFYNNTNSGIVSVGAISYGIVHSQIVDVSTLLIESSSMGVMEGGALSDGGGFVVDIAEGFGYLEVEPEILRKYSWANTSITLSANVNVFIYFNPAGTLVTNSEYPISYFNIVLGRVVTNDTGIEIIDLIPLNAEHIANRLDTFNRDALGAVFHSGCLVSENATDLHINISSGRYYNSETAFNPSGAVNAIFTSYYRDGLGGWTKNLVNVVDNTNYDNGSGTLVGLSSGYYAQHSLYLVGEGTNEKYFLVYPQAQYSSLTAARAGSLSTPPNYFTDGVVLIASIIIQEGFSNIVEIIDHRPRVGFAAPSISGVTNHGDLTGLGDDDHTQYLLISGARSMTGNLSMGGNDITSVGLVDGVDVSAHGSRHLPNGVDPLTTGVPSTIGTSNAEGIQNAFARQDHVHAHGNQTQGSHHAVVTSLVNGFMSTTDKIKLDTITLGGALTTSGGFDLTLTLTGATNLTLPTSGGLVSSSVTTLSSLSTVGTIISGTWNAGVIGAIYGGTGQSVYSVGDLLYADTTTSLSKLSDVATGNALISGGVGVAPSWGKIGLSTHVTGVLSETNGGTNQSGYTLGDILYSSATNTLSKLAGNTTATRKFLRQSGTGVVSAAPAWDTIVASDIPASALTKVDDTNVTLTLGGAPSTALLNATSLTLGWTGQLSPSRGGTGVNNGTNILTLSGNLTTTGAFNTVLATGFSGTITLPSSTSTLATLALAETLTNKNSYNGLVITANTGVVTSGTWNGSVISEVYGGTNQSSYTLGDILYSSAGNTLSKLAGNTTTTRKFLRQTGNGTVSAAPAWDTLTASDISGSALTKTDDTNVTLTLGGTPSTALLNAASLTLGWTGQLSVSRGGTGASTLTGVLIGNGTSAFTTKTNPTGAFVGTSDSQSLTNKTLDNTNTITLKDTLFTLQDDGDTTKQLQFQLSGITTATTRTLTAPDFNGVIAAYDSVLKSTLQTTNAVTTTIQTVATSSNVSYLFQCEFISRKISGAGGGSVGDTNTYIRFFKVKNVAGTLTVGTFDAIHTDEDINPHNVSVTTSTTNVLIQVLGSTNNTVNWVLKTKIITL